MQIIKKPIDSIRPDPGQPRKIIDHDRIEEMAMSIKEDGLINPIEIDPQGVIITGEMRWRACKKAGLTEIDCRVVNISGKERFLRQIIENIHHNTMNVYDTAEAFKKVIDMYFVPQPNKRGAPEEGITWLASKTGKSKSQISEIMGLLNKSEKTIEKIKSGEVPYTSITDLNSLPDSSRWRMERKVTSGELKTRDIARKLKTALNLYPKFENEILAEEYKKCEKPEDVAEVLRNVIPNYTETPITDAKLAQSERVNELVKNLLGVTRWLRNNDPQSVGTLQIKRVIKDLVLTKAVIEKWLGPGMIEEERVVVEIEPVITNDLK